MRRFLLVLVSFAAVLWLLAACGGADHPRRPSGSQHASTSRGPHRSDSPPGSAHPNGSRVVLGNVVQTDYGPVQVRLATANGRIIDVTTVQLPHAAPMDRQLSEPAAATLRGRVLAAQSADVDSVSGATFTSSGYLRSLESALHKLRR
jgi:uncharacterized protein with FMN-binding domain